MRVWSLHPGMLDRPALVAGWREALLAQAVLAGRTKGFLAHPQLEAPDAAAPPVPRGARADRVVGAAVSAAQPAGDAGDSSESGRARDALVIRPRRPEDLPVLVAVLLAQQPFTSYPVRNPLPFPVEDFLHARDAEEAWVAEIDGRAVGHVCWTLAADPTAAAVTACAEAHRCAVSELGWVSTLFVAPEAGGHGVGRRLLATAVDAIRGVGHHPCLEVVDLNPVAGRLYRSTGWVEVLRTRPEWLAGAVADPEVGESIMVLPAADGA